MGREDFKKISLCPGNSNAIWPELFAKFAGPPSHSRTPGVDQSRPPHPSQCLLWED